LPERFSLRELNEQIAATNAAPVGFVHEWAHKRGAQTEITRAECFEHGMHAATRYETTVAGTPAQMVNLLVPELQRRGRVKREYRGKTWRENLTD